MAFAMLSHKHIFGLKSDVANLLHFVDENLLLYPAGHNTVVYNMESKAQRMIQGTEGTRGITAYALSSNARYLAVAERGQRGTISVYDLHTLKKRKILQSTDSSSPEFVSLCFSSDHRYILSQGGAPDWAMVLWQWEKARPLNSIKVSNSNTSPVGQCSFNPTDPSVACATGNGIFKAFRIADNAFKAMPSLLGDQVEAQNFTCHIWLPGDRVLLGTDDGKLILFEAGEYLLVLPASPHNDDEISCMVATTKGFAIGSLCGVVRIFEQYEEDTIANGFYKEVRMLRVAPGLRVEDKVCGLTMPKSEEVLLAATTNNQIYKVNLTDLSIVHQKAEEKFELLSSEFHGRNSAGACTITGMDVCVRKPLVATCGLDSSVRVWNYLKRKTEVHRTFSEEAHSVAFHPSGMHLLVGFADKLRLLNLLMDDIRMFREIPIKNCRECKFSNGGHLFAAVNGNTVQIFNFFNCECVGTMRGHNGKVRSIHWTEDDAHIITCGMDGAVYQWELKEFKREGEYVKKGCNYSCAVANAEGDTIFAVGNDRVLREIEFPASTVTKEIESNCVLGQLLLSKSQRMLFAGTANPDQVGCVRSYKFPLTGEFTEYQCLSAPVTKLCISPDDAYVFVTGEDGSFCILEVREKDGRPIMRRDKDLNSRFAEEVLVTKSDLEEKSTLMAELKNKVDELTLHNEYQLRLKDMNYNEQIKEVTEKFTQKLEHDKNQYEMLCEEKNDMEIKFEERVKTIEDKQHHELQELETAFQSKIMGEVERYQLLTKERDTQQTQWHDQQKQLVESHDQYVREVTEDYEQKLEEDKDSKEQMIEEQNELMREFEETRRQLECDIDQEIEELKEKYEGKLNAEREATLRFKGENGIMKKKFSALQKDIEVQREDIKSMLDKEQELLAQIKVLAKEIQTLKARIRDRDETIGDKEKRIYDLKKKNQELEKFKFVLDYKIKELKRQIEPRENEIAEMKEQIKNMDQELEQYHKSNASLDDLIGELRHKLDGMQKIIMRQRQRVGEQAMRMTRFCSELEQCVVHIQHPQQLRDSFVRMYKLHVPEQVKREVLDSDIQHEYHRQKDFLERSVDALKKRFTNEVKMHKESNLLVMKNNMKLIKEIHEYREQMQQMRLQSSMEVEQNKKNITSAYPSPAPRVQHDRRHQHKKPGRQLREASEAQSVGSGLLLHSPAPGFGESVNQGLDKQEEQQLAAAESITDDERRVIEAQRFDIGQLQQRIADLEAMAANRRPSSREKLAPLN